MVEVVPHEDVTLDVRLRHAARRPDVARQERELAEEHAGSERDDRVGTFRLDDDVDGTGVDHVEYVAVLALFEYDVTRLVGLGECREGEGVELRVAEDVREELVLDFDLRGVKLVYYFHSSYFSATGQVASQGAQNVTQHAPS